MGLNSEFWGYIESIFPGGVLGLLSKTQDDVWDLFSKLAWNIYEFEQAKNNFGYPTSDESVFPANPSPQDHFINSYDPSYYYISPTLCDSYESSGHDVHIALFMLMLMLSVQVWKRRQMH